MRLPAARDEQVADDITGQMPAFEQHGIGALGDKLMRRTFHFTLGDQRPPCQQSGFVQVGRYQQRPGKQLALQRGDGGACDQHRTAGRHHHRIEHDLHKRVAIDCRSDGLHDIRRMQHADLDGICANVFKHRIDLMGQHLGRHAVNGAHAQRVLCRQRGNGRHAVAAERSKCFQVRLDSCTAAAVGASDGKDPGIVKFKNLVHRPIFPAKCPATAAPKNQLCCQLRMRSSRGEH